MKKKLYMVIGVIAVISLLVIMGCSSKPTKTVVRKIDQKQEVTVSANCDTFPEKLDACSKYKCKFTHPLTRETLQKEILGITDGKCQYVEQMPNNGKMECKYTESMRKAAAKYYADVAAAESSGSSIKGQLRGGTVNIETKYTIDGKEVVNPLQEALTNGQCIISGYQ